MKFEVKKTQRAAPVRAVIYGRGGIGKSTLAASAPHPVFLAAEEGLEQIDAAAIEPYPKTFEDVLGALDYVATTSFETIAIDSLDWLEPLVWDYVCRKNKKEDIEAFGYGKGYVAALDQWRVFIHKLTALRARGMNVVLIAHAIRKPFKNPEGDDYEHWTIKIHEKAAGLIVEWSDVVGFFDEDVSTEDTSGRVKAQTTGRRVLKTRPNPAYLAKTRYALPPKLVLPRERPWDVFAAAIKAGDGATVAKLRDDVESLIRTLGDDEVETKVRAFVRERGETAASLAEAIERLNITIEERRKAS